MYSLEELQSSFSSRSSVLPCFLLFSACLSGVAGGDRGGVTRCLQVIEKFVSGWEFVLTGDTAKIDFLLQGVKKRK